MTRYVVGIGSQRAGSTLLHHTLNVSSEVFMHPVKELHYFDTLHGVRGSEALRDFSLRQLGREIDRIVGSRELDFLDERYRCYLRTNRILGITPISEVEYVDLFRPFVGRQHLLGEITPEYMLLGDMAIRSMRDAIGEDSVVILVCRHPVKRMLSAVKLMSVYNGLGMDDSSAREWLLKILESSGAWIQAQDSYNDYVGTIKRYSTYFRRLIVITYDRLVAEPELVAKEISDIGEFRIDTNVFAAATKQSRNDLGKSFDVGSDVESILFDRYEGALKSVQQYLGLELSK